MEASIGRKRIDPDEKKETISINLKKKVIEAIKKEGNANKKRKLGLYVVISVKPVVKKVIRS